MPIDLSGSGPHRVLIFGNSGAGKSTLARRLAAERGLPHLDLDTLAWQPENPTTRRPLDESLAEIGASLRGREIWVVEGCYSDLLGAVVESCTQLVFLNPGVEVCVAHCRARPWEPHKYPSKEAQDANLDLLIAWVQDYDTRTDVFSLASHRRLFDDFPGKKLEITAP